MRHSLFRTIAAVAIALFSCAAVAQAASPEGLEAHRAEDLFRRRKAGQQPLKVVGALDSPADFIGKHRLGRAGGADNEDVMAGAPSINAERSRNFCFSSSRIFFNSS